MDDRRLAALEARKRQSFSQLLIKAARLVNERAIGRARTELDAPELRASHLALLPHIPFEGIRQSELARKLEVSRQAVGQLVAELVAQGSLELAPDPADRRAKLVRFSAAGEQALFSGMSVLASLDAELADAIGAERAVTLRDTLEALVTVLEPAS